MSFWQYNKKCVSRLGTVELLVVHGQGIGFVTQPEPSAVGQALFASLCPPRFSVIGEYVRRRVVSVAPAQKLLLRFLGSLKALL